MKKSDIDKLSEIVRSLSAQHITPFYQKIQYNEKEDGSLITEVDHAMQFALEEALNKYWPKFDMLGEEMAVEQQQQRLSEAKHGTWVVDPLDGTANFSAGVPFFSVSIALIEQGQLSLGLVYDPIRDECFTALKGQGAYLNGEKLDLSGLVDKKDIIVGIVDLKRLTHKLQEKLIRKPIYKSQRSFGSVALDWVWLAAGRGQVYVHGSQNLWDYAAGHLVFSEAGGCSATLHGEAVYNGALEKRSAVAAINVSMQERWLTYLQSD